MAYEKRRQSVELFFLRLPPEKFRVRLVEGAHVVDAPRELACMYIYRIDIITINTSSTPNFLYSGVLEPAGDLREEEGAAQFG